jgi:hypothetical protein
MKNVVIGGAGLIGSKSATSAPGRRRGDRRLTESRRQYDLPQKGRKKLAGAHVVIDLSNSPKFDLKAVLEFFETAASRLLKHLPPQASSSSGGCTPKPCIPSDHCSATTAPLTGCKRAIEAKAVIGR